MKRKIISCILILCIVLTSVSGLAAGKKTKSSTKPTVLYTAKVSSLFKGAPSTIYKAPTDDPKELGVKIGQLSERTPIQIVEVLPNYVGILLKNGNVGYLRRERIENPVPVDPKTTPPFGTVYTTYFAEVTQDTPVLDKPNGTKTLVTLHKGAMVAFFSIENGWAKTIYMRRYGYMDTRLFKEIKRVANSIEEADEEHPLAVYNSFYVVNDTEKIKNRIVNLEVCSKRADRVMQPGEKLDFNNTVGPFRPGYGYKKAGALANGKPVLSYGGGSCQASSTLYNVVLQLTGLTTLVRAPHGVNGAPYLPHGVDASSGNLNFVFRNDYDFPITIKSKVQDGAFFFAIYKGALK